MRFIVRSLSIFALPFFALAASAAPEDLEVRLHFDPHEEATAPALPAGFTDHAVSLEVRDGRQVPEPGIVGEGTTDDDRTFDIRTENDVVTFVDSVIREVADAWDIPIEGGAGRKLVATVTRFWVAEKNKPVGSRYYANVHVTFRLEGRAGEQLWEAAMRGEAERFGRKRSTANCNEVLSEALQEVLAAHFDQPRLQAEWVSDSRAEPLVAAEVRPTGPGQLLEELRDLLERGFGTETLKLYVEQSTLREPLTVDDLKRWKEAGIPEEVVRAALRRGEEAPVRD